MQNRILDQAAFILHRRDYQDSSLILDLLTEDFGRMSVLVRGAKKRRDAASFQICNRLLVGWSGRSELKFLTQIDSHPLSVSAEFMPGVFYINELLLHLLPKQDDHHQLFHSYQNVLLKFCVPGFQLEPVLRSFEIELLSELGVMPDLSIDTMSGSNMNAQQYYYFDGVSGMQHAPEGAPNSFSVSELLAINERQFDSVEELRSAKRLMRQIIDFNLQGRTLQSRKFYQQLKKK